MKDMKKINIPKDECIKLYESGMTTYKIAEQFKCDPETIRMRLKEWGIKRRTLTRRKESVNKNISEIDLAYIAGFFDGEGSLNWYDYSRSPMLSIINTDYNLLTYIKKTLGVGNIYDRKFRGSKYKPIYSFQLYRINDVYSVLKKLQPYVKEVNKQLRVKDIIKRIEKVEGQAVKTKPRWVG